MPTLQQYASENTVPTCSICRLPDRLLEQVNENEGYDLAVGRPVVIAWLKSEGVLVSEASMRRHRTNCLLLEPASHSTKVAVSV